jgi:hypothetical protein
MRDTNKLYGLSRRFETLFALLEHGDKQPVVGVTQGGSSRRYPGAKPAANDGALNANVKQNKEQ